MLALLLIDLVEDLSDDFVSGYGPIGDSIGHISDLVKLCRQKEIPVYDIQWKGSIHPALEDLIPSENRFKKNIVNAFGNPVFDSGGNEINLGDHLREYDTLIVIGHNYHCCVKYTAIGGRKSGYKVLTCRDYSFTFKDSILTNENKSELMQNSIKMYSAAELQRILKNPGTYEKVAKIPFFDRVYLRLQSYLSHSSGLVT